MKGLFLPTPSAAVCPAPVAYTIMLSGGLFSTIARPLDMLFKAPKNGLSRHASRMTMFAFEPASSIFPRTSPSLTPSYFTSFAVAMELCVGMR